MLKHQTMYNKQYLQVCSYQKRYSQDHAEHYEDVPQSYEYAEVPQAQ